MEPERSIEFEGREVQVGHLPEALAPYGDIDRGLRRSRPSGSGLAQYVWRMARFHSGKDTHMPVTCFMWLREWMHDEGLLPERPDATHRHEPERMRAYNRECSRLESAMANALSPVVDDVLSVFGLDDTQAARRWKRAGLVS